MTTLDYTTLSIPSEIPNSLWTGPSMQNDPESPCRMETLAYQCISSLPDCSYVSMEELRLMHYLRGNPRYKVSPAAHQFAGQKRGSQSQATPRRPPAFGGTRIPPVNRQPTMPSVGRGPSETPAGSGSYTPSVGRGTYASPVSRGAHNSSAGRGSSVPSPVGRTATVAPAMSAPRRRTRRSKSRSRSRNYRGRGREVDIKQVTTQESCRVVMYEDELT